VIFPSSFLILSTLEIEEEWTMGDGGSIKSGRVVGIRRRRGRQLAGSLNEEEGKREIGDGSSVIATFQPVDKRVN